MKTGGRKYNTLSLPCSGIFRSLLMVDRDSIGAGAGGRTAARQAFRLAIDVNEGGLAHP